MTHLANYPTIESAQQAANGLNRLSQEGNPVMNCNHYAFEVGDPKFSCPPFEGMDQWRGIYKTVKPVQKIVVNRFYK